MKTWIVVLVLSFGVLVMNGFMPAAFAGIGGDGNIEMVVKGNTAFALDLYAHLEKAKGNLFFSPYSIYTALAMTYAGARGQTKSEMASVLHFPLKQEALHEAFSALQSQLHSYQKKGDIQLSIANALWCQQGYRLLDKFVDLTSKYYGSGIHEVDFAKSTEIARENINAWVEKQTAEKIKNLLKPGVLSHLTRLVLTNAIYFKGNWASEFEKDQTKPRKFSVTPTLSSTVPMMHQTDRFRYKDFGTFQVIELPYAGEDLSMVVFLPKKIDGLSKLEGTLSADNVTKWLKQLSGAGKRRVSVFLPKFKTTSEFDLSKEFISMGMPSAFGNADFSGITGKRDFAISNVIHKAYVDVNEEGTEAAAATAVVMVMSAARPHPVPVFRADHPFLFVIRDTHSGSILFLGRIINPKK